VTQIGFKWSQADHKDEALWNIVKYYEAKVAKGPSLMIIVTSNDENWRKVLGCVGPSTCPGSRGLRHSLAGRAMPSPSDPWDFLPDLSLVIRIVSELVVFAGWDYWDSTVMG
jgi:hypothetical protein